MQIDHFEMKSNESPLNKWTNWRNEDDWFREDKQGSPQPDYPMTYDDQSDDDGRGEAEDQCFIEEAEAAQVDYEIMDWLFKCMTLTLLSLILLGVIIILVKVWNPVGSAPEEEGLGGAPRAVGGAQRFILLMILVKVVGVSWYRSHRHRRRGVDTIVEHGRDGTAVVVVARSRPAVQSARRSDESLMCLRDRLQPPLLVHRSKTGVHVRPRETDRPAARGDAAGPASERAGRQLPPPDGVGPPPHRAGRVEAGPCLPFAFDDDRVEIAQDLLLDQLS
eukprot:GHVH01005940.1.p1 GENE.GHVH01005940.1~~GHVH01005940.1.p1  ORF type:complete len:277 (+),score=40.27 GHVH01005940.1:154-984(+)